MGKLRHRVVDPPFLHAQAKSLTQGMGTGRFTQQHHGSCGVWVLGLKGFGTELQVYRTLTKDEGHRQWAGWRT